VELWLRYKADALDSGFERINTNPNICELMGIGTGEEGIGVAMIWDDRLRSGWSGYTAPNKKGTSHPLGETKCWRDAAGRMWRGSSPVWEPIASQGERKRQPEALL
jgi:hypothetical protein